ncbi:hypothetical protein GCM10022406_16080 [Hymenobacter algoricola]|uniref:Uncharacterized protein n=1 Tax=Hymenobacter algoricola TaxID=486267 RepID=A0ABP7MWU2_9BACT
MLGSPLRAQSLAAASIGQPPVGLVPPEPLSGWQRRADSLLAPLDKTPVTGSGGTSVLYDRVAGLASLDVFNLASSDADTSSFSHFLQAYYELRCASYAPVPALPTRADLRSTSQHYARHDTVLIAALRYRLQYIDSNAVHNNQLRWENVIPSRLFDIPNRIGSPYKDRETAIAAALTDSLQSGTVRFYLPAALSLGNAGVALQQVTVAFGNNQPEQVLMPGQSAQVWYDSPGQKTLRYRLLYADGREFLTYSTLYVPKAACTTCRPQSEGCC